MIYVYCWTAIASGKKYVGITKNLKNRNNQHYSEAFGQNSNLPFYNSLKKYGKDGFRFEILKECDTVEDAKQSEIEFIQKLNTLKHNG